jgi:hypothetical protein
LSELLHDEQVVKSSQEIIALDGGPMPSRVLETFVVADY